MAKDKQTRAFVKADLKKAKDNTKNARKDYNEAKKEVKKTHVKNTDKKEVKKTEQFEKKFQVQLKDDERRHKGWGEKESEYKKKPEQDRDKHRKTKTRDEKEDLNWRKPNGKGPQTTWINDEEHSRHVKRESKHDKDISGGGWRMKEDKKKDSEKQTPKPKGGYPDHPQGMSGGSSVPRKPGPKKPASPAAKKLQRTASRSK